MRFISLFLFVSQVGFLAQAAGQELKSPIQNPDIVCADVTENLKVVFNTTEDKIWLAELNPASDVADELQGKVYTGIHSPDRFVGEVMAEIVLKTVPMYIALILRDVDGQPVLDGTYYEQGNAKNLRQFKLNCIR